MFFTIYGRPQPAGSKTAFKHPSTGRVIVTDAAKGSRPWKQQVAGVVREARPTKFTGPVGMTLVFFLRRPKSHFGSGKNSAKLKSSAPAYPTTRPDTLKLARAVEDALTDAGLWGDDAQVVHQVADKAYGDPERVEISVWALPATMDEPIRARPVAACPPPTDPARSARDPDPVSGVVPLGWADKEAG